MQVDKKFAKNIKVKFYSPEEIFPLNIKKSIFINLEKDSKEVVIMVGYPASGKSTIAHSLNKENYYVVSGDIHKTVPKMIKDAQLVEIKKNEKNSLILQKNINYQYEYFG